MYFLFDFAGVNTSASSLKEYARSTAGKPLLYGICLQKQHLDPNHYPRKLSVKNNYRVFLYRYSGCHLLFVICCVSDF